MFGFGAKQKKLRGVQLIDSVADRFTDMVTELEEGMCQCQEERDGICVTIDQLKARDAQLSESSKRASTIADNLRTLLGA